MRDPTAACADAVALARLQRDGRAYVVHAERVAAPDPMAAFAAAAGRRRLLLWNGDDWLLAVGAAHATEASGPGRCAAAARAQAAIEHRCIVAAPDDAPALPVLTIASAFEERAAPAGHWGERLPGMRLVLPRVLWWRRGGACWRIRATEVAAGDSADAVAARLAAEPPREPTAQPVPWAASAVDFPAMVEDAATLIRHGAMRKVVLARAVDVPTAVRSASEAIPRLRALADRDSAVYAVDLDDGACFVGATPEPLFAAEGTRLTTRALAGTGPRGRDAEEDRRLGEALLGSTKERKEHQLVVEHIVSVLRPRCAPFAIPASPSLRMLARIQHLETRISAELLTAEHLELLGALQPTPAVCGLPTPLAQSYVARHERIVRGLYAGALGWISPRDCATWVPLRGGILRAGPDGGIVRCFAGAGVVETSDPEAELAETELKLRFMRAAVE